MKLRREQVRSPRSKYGEVTIEEPYSFHPMVPRLKELFKKASKQSKGKEIPSGQIPAEVITRIHNAETVRDLMQLLSLYRMKKMTGSGMEQHRQLVVKYGKNIKPLSLPRGRR